jgi:glycosyltransferase involved in cell wall biosynthesis
MSDRQMSDTPKIALVTGGLQFGGTTTFLLNLIAGLRARGVACAVFSFSRANPFAAEFESLGAPVCAMDESRAIFEDRLAELYQRIAQFNPGAIIANIGADAYEMLRYVPAGVARIGIIHDLAMNPAQLIPRYEDVLDGVAVVNAQLLEVVQRAAPKISSRYLTHGVRLPENLRPRNPNPAGPLRILFLGRLTEGKGTRVFPLISDQLRGRNVPFQWTIHGEGPDETFLREKFAREITEGQVVLSSQIPRERIFPLIQQHDIFIMASEIEGGPLTLLETMAAGLVPVCNDIPCLAQEVVTPANGFLIPFEAARYAQCIGRLHEDRALLEKMSGAARQMITARFTAEAMAERYLDFISPKISMTGKSAWHVNLVPKAIRGAGVWTRAAQTVGAVRSVRRALKRMKSR